MSSRASHRLLIFVWSALLLSPLAWGASLVSMLWLTHPVCQGLPHSVLIFTGVGCAVLALAGSSAASAALRRVPRDVGGAVEVPAFLLQLALWGGLIFTLVIILSLLPANILTPCPV